MAERTEGLKVPGREGAAADHRLAEVEVRRPGNERGVAPGAPAALPLEDGPHDLVREIPSRGDRLRRMRCCRYYSAPGGHAVRCPPGTINFTIEGPTVTLR